MDPSWVYLWKHGWTWFVDDLSMVPWYSLFNFSLTIHLLTYVTYHHFSVVNSTFWLMKSFEPAISLVDFLDFADLLLLVHTNCGARFPWWNHSTKDWTPYWMTFPMVLKMFEVWILTGQHLKHPNDIPSVSPFLTWLVSGIFGRPSWAWRKFWRIWRWRISAGLVMSTGVTEIFWPTKKSFHIYIYI